MKAKKFIWVKHLVMFPLIFIATTTYSKTFYLDSQLSANCLGTYSVENRNNTGNSGIYAYNNIQDAMDALEGGDTLFIRAGNYSRTGFDTRDPTEIGALDIGWNNSCNGSSDEYTVVMAYPGEQPVILAELDKPYYNPNPADESYTQSSLYYSNPAIGLHGEYIVISGLKTFGQVTITYANNVILENCDLGGGGPHCGQGNVIVLNYDAHNVLIRNNLIHNSCWGENNDNGSAIICYYASAIIENNEFYDNWGGDVYIKDTYLQQGRIVEIRRNFFGPSSIYPYSVGYIGHNQAWDIDEVYVHHNIFLQKFTGIQRGTVDDTGIPLIPYNNTFVNCFGQDIHDWGTSYELISYNNLFYHSNGEKDYYSAYQIGSANWNLFYSTTNQCNWRLESSVRNTLTEWQTFANEDLNSVYKNPGFVNPAGNRPVDFKRLDYSGDVTGSSYSTMCGAYEAGNEIIGITPGSILDVETSERINSDIYLKQNIPNPFQYETKIPLYIPQETNEAWLNIYNQNGQQIAKFKVEERGYSYFLLNAGSLKPGVYFYSILIENKEIETKQMLYIK